MPKEGEKGRSPRTGKPPDFKALWVAKRDGVDDWREIGVGFAHDSATGANVILSIIPIGGKFHLRAVLPPGIDRHATSSGTDDRNEPLQRPPSLEAFSVLRDGKTWIRIGSAKMHSDRLGWSVSLDAAPVDGYVILKEAFAP